MPKHKNVDTIKTSTAPRALKYVERNRRNSAFGDSSRTWLVVVVMASGERQATKRKENETNQEEEDGYRVFEILN
jgi:hypothetical protein